MFLYFKNVYCAINKYTKFLDFNVDKNYKMAILEYRCPKW